MAITAMIDGQPDARAGPPIGAANRAAPGAAPSAIDAGALLLPAITVLGGRSGFGRRSTHVARRNHAR